MMLLLYLPLFTLLPCLLQLLLLLWLHLLLLLVYLRLFLLLPCLLLHLRLLLLLLCLLLLNVLLLWRRRLRLGSRRRSGKQWGDI